MPSETMTLAFELAAIQQTRELQAVIVEARRWAQSVGLITADAGAAHTFSSENLVRRDFQVMPTTSNVALLNARQRRGRVDSAQSYSVRDEFLTSEDAVAVTHSGC